jgi:hypothetical protein
VKNNKYNKDKLENTLEKLAKLRLHGKLRKKCQTCDNKCYGEIEKHKNFRKPLVLQ